MPEQELNIPPELDKPEYRTGYQKYCERRAAYNFYAVDYLTWLAWHLNRSLRDLRQQCLK